MNTVRRYLILIGLFFICAQSWADHLIGYYYELECVNAANNEYELTFYLYRNCLGAPIPNSVTLSFFNGTGVQVRASVSIPVSSNPPIIIPTTGDPCVTVPPTNLPCIEKYTYAIILTIPHTPGGVYVVFQSATRPYDILTLQNPGSQGVTFSGHMVDPDSTNCNSSPVFINEPPLLLCINSVWNFNMSATDADGDSLVYRTCLALQNSGTAPNFNSANYAPGFSYSNPIPANPPLNINSATGQLSCTPTAYGKYLIKVCVDEYRNGLLIGAYPREFQVQVVDCNQNTDAGIQTTTNHNSAAIIDTIYSCTGYTVNFTDQSINSFNWHWDFGDYNAPAGSDTSILQNPAWTYADTGNYPVTLIINKGTYCVDTAVAIVRVLPPLFVGFEFSGQACQFVPYQFTDTSMANYGNIVAWNWRFVGVAPSVGTSSVQHLSYSFPFIGNYTVWLRVETDEGCIDSVSQVVNVSFTPGVSAGADKTVALGDTIKLNSIGSGSMFWSPSTYLIDTITNPKARTVPLSDICYVATIIGSNGCNNTDTVCLTVNCALTTILPDNPAVSPDTILSCTGLNVPFEARGVVDYFWDFGDLTTTSDTSSLSTPIYSYPTFGDYEVTLIANQGYLCTDTLEVVVRVLPELHAAFSVDTAAVCLGQTINFTDQSTTSGSAVTNYTWDFDDGKSGSGMQKTHKYDQPGIYQVTLTIQNGDGCIADAAHLLEVYPPPTIQLPGDTAIIKGDTMVIAAISSGGQINWIPSTGQVFQNGILYMVSPDTATCYVATIVDSNGCVAQDTICISVYPVGMELRTDSAISILPNPAGDYVIIQAPTLSDDAELLIFNTAGAVVLRAKLSRGITETSVDITHLPSAPYLIRITGNGLNATGHFIKLSP